MKQSYALRDQVKEHWKHRSGSLHPIAEGTRSPAPDGEPLGTTNEEEDEAGYEVVEKSYQPIPVSSKLDRQPKHGKSSSSHSSSSRSLPPADGIRLDHWSSVLYNLA